MPLKKPNEIPKIPKTRKKKAQAAIEAIPPAKKPNKIEYVCKAYFNFDKTLKKQFTVISIETVVEFTSFAYEISLDYHQEKDDIYFVLMGLKAKTNQVPAVQPAVTKVSFEDLIGEYTVNIVKQDGSMNSGVFKFNTFSKEIKLLKEFVPEKENNRLFCKFQVDESLFSFDEEKE